jgi:hypothetical protein
VTVDAYPVPLRPRWLHAEPATHRAGAEADVRVVLRNDGSATWRSRGADGLQLSYHWLDPLLNPVLWDGRRTPFATPVAPGETAEAVLRVSAPRPPGRYVLRFDLVEEHHFWLEEVGCATLDVPADVLPRIARRALAVVVHGGTSAETDAALAAQEEAPCADGEAVATAHLVAGAVPPTDWVRRLLDGHEEGWPAVGVAVAPGGGPVERARAARMLRPWQPGGRKPRFDAPVLMPSLLSGLEPGEHLGMPAYEGPEALFDGRATVTLPPRSGRRRT